MNSDELVAKAEELFATLKEKQGEKFKKSKNDARKTSVELVKVLKEFKKTSVAESKAK